jgi:hypothetical protein
MWRLSPYVVGHLRNVKFEKVINEEIDHNEDGVSIKGGVNAVIAANVGEKGSVSHVSSKQRIVQRSSRSRKKRSDEEGPKKTG